MGRPRTSVKAPSGPEAVAEASPSADLVRAFNDLRDELVSTLWFVLGNREDAQDTAQEAFLKCWRAQDSLADVRDMKAWIFRVGLNAAKDLQRSAWHRRARFFNGDETMLAGNEVAPIDQLEDRECLDALRRAILNLRPEEKEVFLLRQNGDLTYEEIATMRQSPVGTVKTQMRSALQKLRRHLA